MAVFLLESSASEMSTQSLVDRMIASEAYVDSWKLRTGRLSSDDEFARIRDAWIGSLRFATDIDDESSMNIMQMRAKARRLQAEHGLGLIIIDYPQSVVPRQKFRQYGPANDRDFKVAQRIGEGLGSPGFGFIPT